MKEAGQHLMREQKLNRIKLPSKQKKSSDNLSRSQLRITDRGNEPKQDHGVVKDHLLDLIADTSTATVLRRASLALLRLNKLPAILKLTSQIQDIDAEELFSFSIAEELLQHCISSKDPNLRRLAAGAFGTDPSFTADATKVDKLLRDRSPIVRGTAATALQLRKDVNLYTDTLLKLANEDPYWSVRNAAVITIHKCTISNPIFDSFVEIIKNDPVDIIKRNAMRTLACQISDEQFASLIIQLLQSRDSNVTYLLNSQKLVTDLLCKKDRSNEHLIGRLNSLIRLISSHPEDTIDDHIYYILSTGIGLTNGDISKDTTEMIDTAILPRSYLITRTSTLGTGQASFIGLIPTERFRKETLRICIEDQKSTGEKYAGLILRSLIESPIWITGLIHSFEELTDFIQSPNSIKREELSQAILYRSSINCKDTRIVSYLEEHGLNNDPKKDLLAVIDLNLSEGVEPDLVVNMLDELSYNDPGSLRKTIFYTINLLCKPKSPFDSNEQLRIRASLLSLLSRTSTKVASEQKDKNNKLFRVFKDLSCLLVEKIMESDDDLTRDLASTCISTIGIGWSKRATKTLITGLEDTEVLTRYYCAKALGTEIFIGDISHTVGGALVERLRVDSSKDLRVRAVQSLAPIISTSWNPEFIDQLFREIEKRDSPTSQVVLEVLTALLIQSGNEKSELLFYRSAHKLFAEHSLSIAQAILAADYMIANDDSNPDLRSIWSYYQYPTL